MTAPTLTDARALALHRARAARAPVDFLHRAAAREVQERLMEVNRTFLSPTIVGPMAERWRDWLVEGGAIADALCLPDAPILALDAAAHDLILHVLCLHWADDPVGQLVQMRRALRPDGLMLAVTFGGQSLAELRAALAEAETAVRGGLSPRVAPMGEIRDYGALLQRAGFALPVADSVTRMVSYADLFALIRDLRGMGESNALAARDRTTPPRALFARTAAIYADRFPDPDTPGRIRATAEFVTLTGWAPGPGQQQPLRPGSASARLADALGVTERSAGDAAGHPPAPPPRITDTD